MINTHTRIIIVYKIPYRRARAWPSGCSAFRPSASREQRYLAYKNNNSFNEIKQIENILDNCSSYNMQELNDLIKANKSTFSIMFNNIDGVTSNFDLFSTKLLSTNNQISILTFAETNLDECNKNLFNI